MKCRKSRILSESRFLVSKKGYMKPQEYRAYVLDKLTQLERKVEILGSLNLRDLNIDCENFYRDLLNLLYGLKLENSNFTKTNQDTFDLHDKAARLVYQVTSSVSREKVNKTINQFQKKYATDYDELYMLFLKRKDLLETPKHKKITAFTSDFGFSVDQHLLDNSDIIKKFDNLSIDKKLKVYELVKKYFDGATPAGISNESEEFRELMADWKEYMKDSELEIEGIKMKGNAIVKTLCNFILECINEQMVHLGRHLFATDHETLDGLYFSKVIRAYLGDFLSIDQMEQNIEKLKEGLLARPDQHDRWEYLKWYFDSVGNEPPAIKDALRAIGSVYFYHQPSDKRLYYYRMALDKVWSLFGDYLDGLTNFYKSAIGILLIAYRRDYMARKINLRLTSGFDVLLLFYILIYKHESFDKEELECVSANVLFDRLISDDMNRHMVDLPYDDQIYTEVKLALKQK